MQNIAVLLTCHNRKEKTITCLTSLFEAILPVGFSLDVFLVDDGSTDGTAEAVSKNFPIVNIIQGDGNLFWNRGMHLAWKSAVKVQEYDFYLWLNDDTFLENNALEIILQDSSHFKNLSIICGACLSHITGECSYSGYTQKTHARITPNGTIQECFFFNGNVVLIPKLIFDKLDNLDPIFHHGLGDFDYGLRAFSNGLKSFVSSAYVGVCEPNVLPAWSNPDNSLHKRCKAFYQPNGAVPFQLYIFDRRHFGMCRALKSLVSLHLRLFFPRMWA